MKINARGLNPREAIGIMERHMTELRSSGYEELLTLFEPKVERVDGSGAARYEIETEAFWDDRPNGNVRVVARLDGREGGSRKLKIVDDFIMAPDGSAVGEAREKQAKRDPYAQRLVNTGSWAGLGLPVLAFLAALYWSKWTAWTRTAFIVALGLNILIVVGSILLLRRHINRASSVNNATSVPDGSRYALGLTPQQERIWKDMLRFIAEYRDGTRNFDSLVRNLEGAMDAGDFEDERIRGRWFEYWGALEQARVTEPHPSPQVVEAIVERMESFLRSTLA